MSTQPKQDFTEGQEAVANFNFYIDLFTSGKLPDGKRYDEDFFKAYPYVKPNSPFHMMFCTFVGALDLAAAATEAAENRKKDLDQEDAETTK